MYSQFVATAAKVLISDISVPLICYHDDASPITPPDSSLSFTRQQKQHTLCDVSHLAANYRATRQTQEDEHGQLLVTG